MTQGLLNTKTDLCRKAILSFMAITALFLLSACERDEDAFDLDSPGGEKLESVIKISAVSVAELPADNSTTSTIKVKISENADSVYRSVIYHTDLGTFANGDTIINVPVNGYGEATAALKSSVAGKAKIRITVKNIPVDTSVVFSTALPDDMLLNAGNYVLTTADSTTITAKLFRNTGTPSGNLKVMFTATPDNPGHDLVLPEFAYSSDGAATVMLKNPFGYSDWYTIKASTQNATGASVEKSIRIRIDP